MISFVIDISAGKLNKQQYTELDKWLFENDGREAKEQIYQFKALGGNMCLYEIKFPKDEDAMIFKLRFPHAIHTNS